MNNIESILYGTKAGQPDYMEEVISTKPEHFKAAKKWALQNGFDRLRVTEINLNTKPDFINTIN